MNRQEPQYETRKHNNEQKEKTVNIKDKHWKYIETTNINAKQKQRNQ